jgi:AAA domain
MAWCIKILLDNAYATGYTPTPHEKGQSMSYLSQRTSAPSTLGQRTTVAGPEKSGKTTFCCGAPQAFLIPMEQGYVSMTCERGPMLTSWEEALGLFQELLAAAAEGSLARGTTLVWDSATAMGRMIDSFVLRTDPDWNAANTKNVSLVTAHGGFGKAYGLATQYFNDWLNVMDNLTMYGINHAVTVHVFSSVVVDPAYGEYNSWDLRLYAPKNGKNTGPREALTEWADATLFLHEPLFVTRDKDSDISKGVSQGKGRVLETERSPSWVGGNRYGVTGGIAIPKEGGWNYYAQAVYEATEQRIDLFKR